MAIIKKMSVASYALALSVVVALVALIVGIVSCSGDGFWVDEMGGVIAFTIVGIVCGAGAVALAVKFGDKPWVSAVVALTVLFFALATCFMIMGKMDVMGTVMFSDLEKGYKPAEDACYIGLASSIIYIVASVGAAIGAFFGLVRKDA